MSKPLKTVFCIALGFLVLTVVGCGTNTIPNRTENLSSNVSKQRQSSGTTNSSDGSLERQVELLQQAVLPNSPLNAAKTWARAIQTRDGALQYAILTPQLKLKMKRSYESWNWSPGASSPWVEHYAIGPATKVGNHQFQFNIIYTLTDSTHDIRRGKSSIVVSEFKHHWYVSNTMGYGS